MIKNAAGNNFPFISVYLPRETAAVSTNRVSKGRHVAAFLIINMKPTILSLLCLSALTFSAVAEDNSAATPTPADNSGRNVRDRDGGTKTSGDQSNDSGDIKITAAIRRAVMKDDSLSMTAKNVKVITADGVVTLRGPVKTEAEKMAIAKHAEANAGDAKVMNQLEIEASK